MSAIPNIRFALTGLALIHCTGWLGAFLSRLTNSPLDFFRGHKFVFVHNLNGLLALINTVSEIKAASRLRSSIPKI
jgi:hypothetical protein